jgi:hypothetical protein
MGDCVHGVGNQRYQDQCRRIPVPYKHADFVWILHIRNRSRKGTLSNSTLLPAESFKLPDVESAKRLLNISEIYFTDILPMYLS